MDLTSQENKRLVMKAAGLYAKNHEETTTMALYFDYNTEVETKQTYTHGCNQKQRK